MFLIEFIYNERYLINPQINAQNMLPTHKVSKSLVQRLYLVHGL